LAFFFLTPYPPSFGWGQGLGVSEAFGFFASKKKPKTIFSKSKGKKKKQVGSLKPYIVRHLLIEQQKKTGSKI
jgi:hypothetical protein